MAKQEIVTFESLAPTETVTELEPTGPERCLADYSCAVAHLEDFKADNSIILALLESLQQDVTSAETFLEEVCREHGPVANEQFAVTVQTKTRRWYDLDTLLLRLPRLRELPGVIVETINRPEVERLIKAGAVPKADAALVLRTEALAPAVTIKRL